MVQLFFIAVFVFGMALAQQPQVPPDPQPPTAPQPPPPQQPQGPDDCLMKCTNELYQKSPRGADAMSSIQVQPVKVGNVTAMCPTLNDTSRVDTSCQSIKQLKQCTDACPDTQIKKLTMSAFKPMFFICIDRIDDIKKNMPCLGEHCPDVQSTCIPKCGSIEESGAKVAALIHRVRGGGGGGGGGGGADDTNGRVPAPPARPGVTGAPLPGQDVDMSTIVKVLGETCGTISCFLSCSEAPVTRSCSKDAYILQRDLVWMTFSGLAQSMSSMGIQMQWPDECKPLAAAAAGNATTVPSVPAGPVSETVAVGTATPAVRVNHVTTAGTVPPATSGTVPPPAGTSPPPAATSPPPAGTHTPQVKTATVNGNLTETGKSTKGAATIFSSTTLILASIFALVIRNI